MSDALYDAIAKVVTGILRRDSAIDYRALYGATILFSDGGTATVKPDLPELGSSLSNCRVRRPDGYASIPINGTACFLGWEGADPSKRYVLMAANDGSDQTEITISALSLKLGGAAAVSPVVIQPIIPALTTVLIAVGVFATAIGAAVPPLAPAAVTLNTAITIFGSSLSSYSATRVKAL